MLPILGIFVWRHPGHLMHHSHCVVRFQRCSIALSNVFGVPEYIIHLCMDAAIVSLITGTVSHRISCTSSIHTLSALMPRIVSASSKAWEKLMNEPFVNDFSNTFCVTEEAIKYSWMSGECFTVGVNRWLENRLVW